MEQPLLEDDVYTGGVYMQSCGCEYVYVTDDTGHVAVKWVGICPDHWLSGRGQ